ncbi:MAG: DUF5591 domain-containing protein [Candidatus Odinarchaeota archaeon]
MQSIIQQSSFLEQVPTISSKTVSHGYIKCDGLHFGTLTACYRDVIRLCDSSDKSSIKDIFNEVEGVSFNSKKRSSLTAEIFNYIRSEGLKHPVKLKKRLLIGHQDRKIIPTKDRRYDEIIGAVFDHQHFEKAYQHILRYHKKKKVKNIALFTTCASIKPYSQAPSFKKLFSFLETNLKPRDFEQLHWLVISNATAPIPEEYHYSFPFYAYETNLAKLTRKEQQCFVDTISSRLEAFLRKFKYENYIAFLKPSSLSLQVLKKVCQANSIDLLQIPSLKTKKEIISEKGLLYWNFQGMKNKAVLDELKKTILQII